MTKLLDKFMKNGSKRIDRVLNTKVVSKRTNSLKGDKLKTHQQEEFLRDQYLKGKPVVSIITTNGNEITIGVSHMFDDTIAEWVHLPFTKSQVIDAIHDHGLEYVSCVNTKHEFILNQNRDLIYFITFDNLWKRLDESGIATLDPRYPIACYFNISKMIDNYQSR